MIENLCNCDARDEVNVDVGVLTSKDQLPVMMLAYGDSRERASWIQYRKLVYNSLFPESMSRTSILLKRGLLTNTMLKIGEFFLLRQTRLLSK